MLSFIIVGNQFLVFFSCINNFSIEVSPWLLVFGLNILLLQKGAGGAGRVPASSKPVGFGNNLDATVDIPLDTMNVRTLVSQHSCLFLT